MSEALVSTKPVGNGILNAPMSVVPVEVTVKFKFEPKHALELAAVKVQATASVK